MTIVTLSFPLFVCVVLLTRQSAYDSLDWVAPSTLFIHGAVRFVNGLPRRLPIVLRARTIRFKRDHFSRWIISYDSWGIRLHEGDSSTRSDWSGRINMNRLYRKGDHFTWGIGYFVTPALKCNPIRSKSLTITTVYAYYYKVTIM